MSREIVMPTLSEAVEEGVLVTWFVEPGATVREGDLVAEVQVEKVAAEVRAPADGRIGRLLAEPGAIVRQGDAITTLEQGSATTRGQAAREAPPAGAAPPGARPSPAAAGTRLEPLSPMRRTIGERMRAGLASTAQLTLTGEADVSDLTERLASPGEAGRRASYTEVAVRACALALRDHPRLGARWTPDGLLYPDRINVGVAVALDEGLIVPVVRDADHKGVEALGREIAELAERARTGRLEPAETEGGSFSVTNLGGHRIDGFTPLLNPPQTAILGLGRARPRPAVVDGSVVPRTLVVLSLTFDHQVVDGLPAAAFLGAVIELLERPDRLLA